MGSTGDDRGDALVASLRSQVCFIPLSPELPPSALSGIKWSENGEQVDLNGDSGDA